MRKTTPILFFLSTGLWCMIAWACSHQQSLQIEKGIDEQASLLKPHDSFTSIKEKVGPQIAQTALAFFKNPQKKFYDPFSKQLKSVPKWKSKILHKARGTFSDQDIQEAFSPMTTEKVQLRESSYDTFWNKKRFHPKQLKRKIRIKELPGAFDFTDSDVFLSNYCNELVGGGVSTDSMTQEEQVIAAGLVTQGVGLLDTSRSNSTPLQWNEIMVLKHLPQFAQIDGNAIYGAGPDWETQRMPKALEVTIPMEQYKRINLLSYDAPQCLEGGPYSPEEIKHIMSKLLGIAAFLKANYTHLKEIRLKFGNWGGGAFRNNLYVIYASFIIVLSWANAFYAGPPIVADVHPMHKGSEQLNGAQKLVEQALDSFSNQEAVTMSGLWEKVNQVATTQGISMNKRESGSW